MKVFKILYIYLFFIIITLTSCLNFYKKTQEIPTISDINSAASLFPKSKQEIDNIVENTIQYTNLALEKILGIQKNERTFANTFGFFDTFSTIYEIKLHILYALTLISPQDNIRQEANIAVNKLQKYALDNISYNKKLYHALLDYNDLIQDKSFAQKEALSNSDLYFIKETLDSFKRAGLGLLNDVQKKVIEIQKDLTQLQIDFSTNIYQDNRSIKVSKEELSGLDSNFINNLKQEDNKYILGIDYPTYFKVLDECEVESTRHKLWKEFVSRGYPKNETILNRIIFLRDQLANLLNYKSYAHLDIDNQMAQNPEEVEKFLQDLIKKASKKSKQEFETFKKDLPDSVKLEKNKFKPWDIRFVKNYYKKKYLSIDESEISKYFELDNTLEALFNIYKKFFSLEFKKLNTNNKFWSPDIQALEVYHKNKFIGILLLDLFPRENKYSHACQTTIVPSVKTKEGKFYPALVLVIANFTKSTKDKPSLLHRSNEVITFFHELGHAIHALLGTTDLGANSGTSVKGDFVEMPSQMLENWMWDSKIIKMVSKHYQTGESLPDEYIQKIIKLKTFDSGDDILSQVFLSLISLKYFGPGENKDIYKILQDTHEKLDRMILLSKESRAMCSFEHLMSYGAKYYGYLWSRVYALDLFKYINHCGLLDPAIGDKYTNQVISKGGSQDPKELLRDFLRRDPNSDAFFEDIGLSKK